MADDHEEPLLRSVALQNAHAILLARQRAERELLQAKEALERKTAELARVTERYVLAERATNDGLWDVNLVTGETYLSPRWKALLGFADDELADASDAFFARLHPDDVPQVREALRRHHAARHPYDVELRLRCKDGSYRWFRSRGEGIRDEAGQVVRMLGAISDITARKEAEAAVHRRTEGLRLLSEAAADLLAATDPTRMVAALFRDVEAYLGADVFFHYMLDDTAPPGVPPLRLEVAGGLDAAARAAFARLDLGQALCGVSAQERRTVYVQDVQHSAHPQAAGVQRLGVRAYACHPLWAGARLLGTLSFASRTKDRFEDDELAFMRTVSHYVATAKERLRAEAALRTLTATLERQVAERTAFLALIQDVTRAANEAPSSAAALQYALDRLCAYTGWPIGHVYLAVAPGADRWVPTTLWHLDDPERFAAFRQATQALEVVASENLIGRVGRGQPAWLCEVATDPAFQRRHAAQAAGLRTGVAWPLLVGSEVAGVLEFYTTEALAPNTALLEAMTQIGTQLGRAVERERAAAQAQRQQEALLQREKLAAMSTMLASVAHELNNPLAAIVLQAEILGDDVRGGALADLAAEIAQAAARCQRLVHQFLTLARQHPPERTVVELNTLVTETGALLAYALRLDDIAVQLELAADLPLLWADPHQLQQVLLNLLTNAQHALREAAAPRQITITTRYDPVQRRVTLVVTDTGPGIPPALQGRIFEPFFTTKPPGVGTGLGLPLCRGILEGHGGTISVTSLPGQGTTFWIEIPVGVVPETTAAPPDARAPSPSTVPSSTILLVDDEPGIAKALAQLLRRDGHTVDTAANGRLALARLQERTYDLILSDLRMPELDGPGLYRALEQHAPQLCRRFIFLTGDTLSPEAQTFVAQSGVPRLTKPFTAAEVRRALQHVLQAG